MSHENPVHEIRDWSGNRMVHIHADGMIRAAELQATANGITANAGGIKSSVAGEGVVVKDASGAQHRIVVSPTGTVSAIPVV